MENPQRFAGSGKALGIYVVEGGRRIAAPTGK